MRLIRAYRGISVSFLYAQQFIYQYLLDLGETPNPAPAQQKDGLSGKVVNMAFKQTI